MDAFSLLMTMLLLLVEGKDLEKCDIAKLIIVALGVPLALAQLGIDLLGDLGARLENIIDLLCCDLFGIMLCEYIWSIQGTLGGSQNP